MLVIAKGGFYSKVITKKVTASHTFVKGESYNVSSREAKQGEDGEYLEIASEAEQKKAAKEIQSKALNAKDLKD